MSLNRHVYKSIKQNEFWKENMKQTPSWIIFLKENLSSNWCLETCCCQLKFMSDIWQCFKENDLVHLDSLIETFRGAFLHFFLEVLQWQCVYLGCFHQSSRFSSCSVLNYVLVYMAICYFSSPQRVQYLSLKCCQLQNTKKIVYPIKVRQNTTVK